MNIQKIQASAKNVKGFTLVELIVVITILVILGTIAFLNLGGFSSSARDSQRTSDLNQISTQIMTLQAKNGTSFTAMASGTTANTMTGGNLAGTGIVNLATTNYVGGDANYTVLGIDPAKMSDPTSNGTTKYKLGATTLVGGAYEVAAKLEESAKSLVMGTFRSRNTTATGAISSTGTNLVSLGATDIGKFFVGDVVIGSGVSAGQYYTGTITKITINSNNGVDLTFNTSAIIGTGSLYLVGGMASDVKGLIKAYTGSITAVSNNSTTELPY